MSSIAKVQHTVKCLNINVTNLENTQIGNNNTLIVIRGIEEDNNKNNNDIYPESEVNLCSKDGVNLRYRARGPSTVVIGDNCTIAEIILNKELVKELETKGQFTVTKGDNLLSVTWYDNQEQKTDLRALKIKFLEDKNQTDTTELEKQVFELLADCQNHKLDSMVKQLLEKLKAKLKHVNMGCIELEFSLDSDSGAGNVEDKREVLMEILRRTIIPEGAVFDIEILPPQKESDDRDVATGTVSSTPSYEESSTYNVEEKSRDNSVDKTINLEDEELGIESTFQEMTTREIKPIETRLTSTELFKEKEEEIVLSTKSTKTIASTQSQEPKDDEQDKVSVMKTQTKDLVISKHKQVIPHEYDSSFEQYIMTEHLNREIDDVRRMLEVEVEDVVRRYWKIGPEEARDFIKKINNAIFTELDKLPTKLYSLIYYELDTEWKRIKSRKPLDYDKFRYNKSIYGAIIDKLSVEESLWSILHKIEPVLIKADKNNITDIIKSLEIEIQMVTDEICSKTLTIVRTVIDEWVSERELKMKREPRSTKDLEMTFRSDVLPSKSSFQFISMADRPRMTTRDSKPTEGWTLTDISKEEEEEEEKEDDHDFSVVRYVTKHLNRTIDDVRRISQQKQIFSFDDSALRQYMRHHFNREIDDVRGVLEFEVEDVASHHWKMGREEARDCRREINNAIFTGLDRLSTKLSSLIEIKLETEWEMIGFSIGLDYETIWYDKSICDVIINKLSVKESLLSILPKIKPVIVKADKNNITDIFKSLEIQIQMVTDEIYSNATSTARTVTDKWVSERGLERKTKLRGFLNLVILGVRRRLEIEVEDVVRHYWKMGRVEARDCTREIDNVISTGITELNTKLYSLIESELETEWEMIEFSSDYNTFRYDMSIFDVIVDELSVKKSLWSILPKIKSVIVKADKNNITDIINSIKMEIQMVTDEICSKTLTTVRTVMDEWVSIRVELREHINQEIDDVRGVLEIEVKDVASRHLKMGREETWDCTREINNAIFTELDRLPTKLYSLIEIKLETEWKMIVLSTGADYNTLRYDKSIYGKIIDKLSLKESLFSILPKIKPVIVKADKNNITDIIKSIQMEIQMVIDQIFSKTKSTVRTVTDEWVSERSLKAKGAECLEEKNIFVE